jgi:hypothetical protein
MKQQVKVAAILQQINRSHIASLMEATVARIMSKPDAQIDTWIRTNENLLCKVKNDTRQRPISEFFETGCIHQQEEE